MNLFIQRKRLLRIDALIQRKSTGCAKELANKLDISRASVYRYLEIMKNEFEAPIDYDWKKKTYYYTIEYMLKL